MIFIESRLGYGLSEYESDRCSYEQYLSEYRAWKSSDLYEIWTHDPCDTSAVLYQLRLWAHWELVLMLVPNYVYSLICPWFSTYDFHIFTVIDMD